MDEKRTLELRLPRAPLQLLKPPSVGSGQGMLGAQASPTSTEPPLVPELSRSPPALRLEEVRTPPVVRTLLLLEKVIPALRERLDPETKDSGPHSIPPRELLTAVEKERKRCIQNSPAACLVAQRRGRVLLEPWAFASAHRSTAINVHKLLFICVPHQVDLRGQVRCVTQGAVASVEPQGGFSLVIAQLLLVSMCLPDKKCCQLPVLASYLCPTDDSALHPCWAPLDTAHTSGLESS